MKWYTKYLTVYEKKFDTISPIIVDEIRDNIHRLQNANPLATVSVIAYNEEKHLLSCLWSLSEMKCKYPIEIIGVDNDSKDKTADVFRTLDIPFYTEKQHSCGFARSCGLAHAKGKFHINIDADTLYPPYYIETMIEALSKDNIVAVSSLWSYFPDKEHPALGLKFYELTRDIYLFLQSFKRPELSVRGLVFAYHTELARSIGIRTEIIRGEDCSLALELKKYGKIKFIRNRKARAVTGYGTVAADGSLFNSFKKRAIKGLKHFTALFYSKNRYEDQDSNLINPGNRN